MRRKVLQMECFDERKAGLVWGIEGLRARGLLQPSGRWFSGAGHGSWDYDYARGMAALIPSARVAVHVVRVGSGLGEVPRAGWGRAPAVYLQSAYGLENISQIAL